MTDLAVLGGNPVRRDPFPLEMPQINEDDISSVVSVLRERRLSIFSSSRIVEFEKAFAAYIGTDYAVAVTSGTAALHSSLVAADIGTGDEVIVPVYTYAATVNAVLLQNALPVFVDVDRYTFNIDVSQVDAKISSKTRAILLVDLFGNPTPRRILMEIADRHKLCLVEDCAQSSGARIHGQRVGSFGIGCHSFGEIKNITSAEGGMVTTNDPEIARRARLVRHAGEMWRQSRHSTIGASPNLLIEMINDIDYELVGHNYRMNALQAALGLSQLQRIDEINQQRIDNAAYYAQALANVQSVQLLQAEPDAEPVYNRFVVLLKPDCPFSRNDFLAALISEGIPAGVYYPKPLSCAYIVRKLMSQGVSHRSGYSGLPNSIDGDEAFPNAEYVCSQQVLLPAYPGLKTKDLEDVVTAVKKVLNATSDSVAVQDVKSKVKEVRAEYFGQFFSKV